MMPPAAPMPSDAEGPLMTSIRSIMPMSVKVALRLPSRNGEPCGMPSNRRKRDAAAKGFAGVAHRLRRFRIAGHGTGEHRGGVFGQRQGVLDFLFRHQGDRTRDLVDRLRAAGAGDDDVFQVDRVEFLLRLFGLVRIGRRGGLLCVDAGADGGCQQENAECGRYVLHGVWSLWFFCSSETRSYAAPPFAFALAARSRASCVPSIPSRTLT